MPEGSILTSGKPDTGGLDPQFGPKQRDGEIERADRVNGRLGPRFQPFRALESKAPKIAARCETGVCRA